MSMSENCTRELPVSGVYFAYIPTSEKALIGVGGVLTLIIIVLYLEQLVYILKTYPRVIKYETCFVTGLYPMFAFSALMSLCVPRSLVFDDLAAFMYFSVTMHLFMNLVISYYGGVDELIVAKADTKASLQVPPCCCCCCCCPSVPVSKVNLRRIRLLVLQVAILRPILLFVSVILWTDEKYVVGDFSQDSAFPYLSVPSAVSTLVAMYGLIVMMRLAAGSFPGGMLRGKFLGLQVVLIVSNLQSFLCQILARFNIPACTSVLSSMFHARMYHYLLMILEMFLLALLSRYVYRRPQLYPVSQKNGDRSPGMTISTPDEVGSYGACVAQMESGDVTDGPKAHTNAGFADEGVRL